jgi:predicted alpha/beta-hydrolase family hydrolase
VFPFARKFALWTRSMIFEVETWWSVTIETVNNPPVVGFLHKPDGPPKAGLVLTHGAGANCSSALLVNVAASLAKIGWAVLRCDLPFRQKRKFGPPSPTQASADRDGLQAALRELESKIESKVFLGGHSYGGRQASMLAAEDRRELPGLLLLSYPLHPPAKPEQLRTAHFPDLAVPCLFVHGTVDPFGSPEEMRAAGSLIPSETHLVFLDGVGHDLGKGKSDVVGRITHEFQRFALR